MSKRGADDAPSGRRSAKRRGQREGAGAPRGDSEARAARREELLDAAATVIRRDGPQVSMDAIAAEAGITKPILYRHFGDRAGLVAALGERFATELLTALGAQLQRDDEPKALLHHTIDAFVTFIDRDPNIYRYLVEQALTQQPEALQGFIRAVAAQVAVVIGERLRDIGADSGPAEVWAVGIVGMVHFAGDWWEERRTMPKARLVSYLTDLLWGGFAGAGFAALGHSDHGHAEGGRVAPLRRGRSTS